MKKFLVLFLCVVTLLSNFSYASNVIGSAEGKRGTGLELQADGTYKWYIKKDDDYLYSDWKKINGKQHYFNEDGIMVTGANEIDGSYYLFGADGSLIKEITEDEYIQSMAVKTADTVFNPAGEKYYEYNDEYHDYMKDVEESKALLLEEEEEKKLLAEEQREELLALNTRIDFDSYMMTTAQKKKVDEVVKKFKEKYIKEGMSDFEKEMMIIQYIVENNKYDYENYEKSLAHEKDPKKAGADPVCYNAYGALVKGTSVCAGYADAFLTMCKACGIECNKISGPTKLDGTGSHAWNMVKIDGDWYLVDTTWDDHSGYGFGNLRNKWLNRTVDDFPEHYAYDYENAGLEIYDDGTTGVSEKKQKAVKMDAPCHSTKYGPKTISYYMLTGKVDTNVTNDSYIDIVVNKYKYDTTKQKGLLWTYYGYHDEISGLESIGAKYKDSSNYFNPDTDKEKIKNYIKKYYDEKKEMVPLAFTKTPTDEFILNRIADELGIKEYYTIRFGNDYFLCMKKSA